MELLIPFMLFFLEWNDAGEPHLTRHPAVYQSEEECQASGTAVMRDRFATSDNARFWCMPIPSNEEFDVLIKQIEAENAARREAHEALKKAPAERPQP